MSIYKIIKNSSTKKLGIYSTPEELPSDALAADLAFVASVGRLFVYTGTGWLPVISDNAAPTWLSKPDVNVTILIGNTYSHTLAYLDPEDIAGTFTYQLTSGSLGNNILTTDNEDFNIQGIEAATFNLTFRASDTVNEIVSTTSFVVRKERWNVEQTSTLNLNQSFANTYFGNAIAIDDGGVYAVAGAYNYGSPSSSAGRITFLKRNGTSWTRLSEASATDAGLGDQFGYSVSINGDGGLAAVGAWADDNDGYINNGAVYIFARVGDAWTQIHKLHGPAANNAYFGKSVAIKDNKLFVGAPGVNSNKGAVYTYSTTDPGLSWTAGLSYTSVLGQNNGSSFGETIAVANEGDSTQPDMTLVVGAPSDSLSRGAVFAIDNDTGDWTTDGGATVTITKLTGQYDGAGDQFGSSLSILDGKIVVGVPYSDFNTLEGGLAYQFYYNTANNSWTEQNIIQPQDPASYDHFGTSVSISTNTEYPAETIKDTVMIGAKDKNAAYGFAWNSDSNTYEQLTKIVPGNISAGDAFGSAVAINGNYGLVSAINRNSTGGTANVGEIFHISLG
jgi:hypothetical protein